MKKVEEKMEVGFTGRGISFVAEKTSNKKVATTKKEKVMKTEKIATPVVKAKREKMEVVFVGKKGISFVAEKELNREINKRSKKAAPVKKAEKVATPAPKAKREKREKMEVVFSGKKNIEFSAEKGLNKEVNRKAKRVTKRDISNFFDALKNNIKTLDNKLSKKEAELKVVNSKIAKLEKPARIKKEKVVATLSSKRISFAPEKELNKEINRKRASRK